jgi:SMI1 / KNR4 family (SUKH-1)
MTRWSAFDDARRGGAPDPEPVRLRVKQLIKRLAGAGFVSNSEASLLDVEALEQQLGVLLPPDNRELLLQVGGPKAPSWRGLWRVHEVASLNHHLPVFQWYPGVIGFGNEGFVVYAFDYRRGPQPTVATLGLSSSEPEDVQAEAESFAEWLERTLP